MCKDFMLKIFDFSEVCIGDDRTVKFDQFGMYGGLIQDVTGQ